MHSEKCAKQFLRAKKEEAKNNNIPSETKSIDPFVFKMTDMFAPQQIGTKNKGAKAPIDSKNNNSTKKTNSGSSSKNTKRPVDLKLDEMPSSLDEIRSDTNYKVSVLRPGPIGKVISVSFSLKVLKDLGKMSLRDQESILKAIQKGFARSGSVGGSFMPGLKPLKSGDWEISTYMDARVIASVKIENGIYYFSFYKTVDHKLL